jgi:hypothetical protein
MPAHQLVNLVQKDECGRAGIERTPADLGGKPTENIPECGRLLAEKLKVEANEQDVARIDSGSEQILNDLEYSRSLSDLARAANDLDQTSRSSESIKKTRDGAAPEGGRLRTHDATAFPPGIQLPKHLACFCREGQSSTSSQIIKLFITRDISTRSGSLAPPS